MCHEAGENLGQGLSVFSDWVCHSRGAVKLYTDFMQSDIIVASPIALATKLSDEVEEGGPADFLSSIEIAIADRADVQLMQNWAHVVTGIYTCSPLDLAAS